MPTWQGADEKIESFPLPPALAKLPPGRHRLSREFVEQNQRNRILLGALTVFGGKGLAVARVQDVVVEASISRATFYKYFADKEACMVALHDEIVSWLLEEAREAAKAEANWPRSVCSVTARLVHLFADDPRLARLCAIEAPLAGGKFRCRHEAALAELARGLRKGRSEQPWSSELPELLEPLLLAGAIGLVAQTLVYGESNTAADLARELPEILLVPYLGLEGARNVVRGSD